MTGGYCDKTQACCGGSPDAVNFGPKPYGVFCDTTSNNPDPPANDTIGTFIPAPAVFYAVLQNVGPELTPETWRDGLFSYNATRSAISQPSLSWGDKGIWPQPDYAGIDDATVIWWDPTATGPDELRKQGTGMYQFVDGGKRYMPGEWPAEDKLFVTNGAVGLYTEAPPGEAPPDFPSPVAD